MVLTSSFVIFHIQNLMLLLIQKDCQKNNNIQINSLCFDEISNLYNEILQNIESLILKNDIYNL